MPAFSKPLSTSLLAPCNAFIVYLLATTLVAPVNTGPTASLKIIPVPVAPNFKVGPTNFNAPINVAPSVPNFNLFLRIAAAFSLPSSPSKDSGSVASIFCCNQLPPSSSVLPKIPPSVSCPVADTTASLIPTGSAQ